MSERLSRRAFTQILGLAGASLVVAPARAADSPTEADVSKQAILYDPAAPVGGNPKGNLNLIVFSDYNCLYCKSSEPDLDRAVKADGNVRVVYKDWPVITPDSIRGAQWALAAKYQGRYADAHYAMMGIPGGKIPAEKMREAIARSGVDMARLDADLQAHADDIEKLLRRNMAQAESLGFMGTPAYIVGEYRVMQTLSLDGFKRVIADARARTAKK